MIGKFVAWIRKVLFRRKHLRLGLYGSTNVGKTTLANRICIDLMGEPMGEVSIIPHETRIVRQKEKITLKASNVSLSLNLLDMPGIAVKVDYRDFMQFGLTQKEAQARAREATKGIIEAVRYIENVDAALLVVDSTEDPYTQVNITILGNLEAKGVPVVIIANKIDLSSANVKRIRDSFPQYPVVEISAMTGENIPRLYEAIASKLA
ncbi:50S ribosome-binding GTPase [Candidatus Micrarchaeota archaeon]|nr:50S ribosome-binding GTPase [Candidatus Micrarchaeota archaeon]